MIKQIFQRLEDPERPYLGPNFWIIKKLKFFVPEGNLVKIPFTLCHLSVTIFVFTQYMDLFLGSRELSQVIDNLKVSMVSIMCVVKADTFLIWGKKWREVIDYVTEADKYERNNSDTTRQKIINSYTKYSRRVSYCYWVLAFNTILFLLLTPLGKYLSSQSFRDGLRNGTELFPHIANSWTPFDKYKWPGSWILVTIHVCAASYGGCIIAVYDTTVIVITVFFAGKLELLRDRCRKLMGDTSQGVSEDEVEKMVRQLHQTHVKLTKYSRLFNSLLSPVMFLYVAICSIMICASGFQVVSTTNKTQKLLMSQMLIFAITQLFVLCWHSNLVLLKSQNVELGLYESNWWSGNVRQRKNLLLLAGQLRITHTFTAGPFTNLTISTFISILKGSYSYFTLLRK